MGYNGTNVSVHWNTNSSNRIRQVELLFISKLLTSNYTQKQIMLELSNMHKKILCLNYNKQDSFMYNIFLRTKQIFALIFLLDTLAPVTNYSNEIGRASCRERVFLVV